MFDNELLISFKFSLLEIENTETNNKITSATGINIITEIFWLIKSIYSAKNNIDLTNTFILKTAIIERECITKFL